MIKPNDYVCRCYPTDPRSPGGHESWVEISSWGGEDDGYYAVPLRDLSIYNIRCEADHIVIAGMMLRRVDFDHCLDCCIYVADDWKAGYYFLKYSARNLRELVVLRMRKIIMVWKGDL